MGKQKRKGQVGAARAFITRNTALRRLQLSLSDFRKLCILKGVYPRDPRPGQKAPKGKNKTYYFLKDIQFMAHDPLIAKFREFRLLKRKMRKAKAKKDKGKILRLKKAYPKYTLEHIIRERYPTFQDALNDLDDALTMVNLFASLPADIKIKVSRTSNCHRLVREFQLYCVRAGALRAAFISVKGYYYQAEIMGQKITWLVPHQYTQRSSKHVDYRVMLAFLELYEDLLGYVNHKLFSTINLRYPPTLDRAADDAGGNLNALAAEPQSITDALVQKERLLERVTRGASERRGGADESSSDDESDGNDDDGDDDGDSSVSSSEDDDELLAESEDDDEAAERLDREAEFGESEDAQLARGAALDSEKLALAQTEDVGEHADFMAHVNSTAEASSLFKGMRFFLSREVPRSPLVFVIRSLGGTVSWEVAGFVPTREQPVPFPGYYGRDSPTITHHVTDRGSMPKDAVLTRQYIQPQWVFDCCNEQFLLPCSEYAPSAKLPAHLSPFVDDEAEGYVPKRREQINRMKQGLPADDADAAPLDGTVAGATELDADDSDADSSSEQGSSSSSSDDDSDSDAEMDAEHREAARKRAEKVSRGKADASTLEQEEHYQRVGMMSKKDRRLYLRMQHGIRKKQNKNKHLHRKRAEAEQAAKESDRPQKRRK